MTEHNQAPHSYPEFNQLDAMLHEVEQIVAPVLLVGGCVRDALMGRPIDDFDLATPLTPDEVETFIRAAGRRPYTIGKRFGTVGFKLNGSLVEITTFRHETYKPHSRHPSVLFVDDVEQDLARRDLTINAIAYDGSLIDPYNGKQDIENNIIRAVGNAPAHMQEDPLRILRVCRFVSKLGFAVEHETRMACSSHAELIYDIAHQRWAGELDKLMLGAYRAAGLHSLQDTDLLRYFFPVTFLIAQQQPHILSEIAARAPESDIDTIWANWAFTLAASIIERKNHDAQLHLAEELIRELGTRLYWSHKRTAETCSAVLTLKTNVHSE